MNDYGKFLISTPEDLRLPLPLPILRYYACYPVFSWLYPI